MKAIGTGAIGFGLVNIPVKLFSASLESSLDLDMLDKKDHAHIKFQRINEQSGKVVEWKNIVKAYNLNGDYVVLEEDFQTQAPRKVSLSRLILSSRSRMLIVFILKHLIFCSLINREKKLTSYYMMH